MYVAWKDFPLPTILLFTHISIQPPDAILAMSVNTHKKDPLFEIKSLLKSWRDYELINSDCSIIESL